ncbi:hypothetical protein M8C21_016153 [Ambrosia artemisiifolia]|uniref:Uncharacterized protein n=1 Tax=Ambrosia artemisiifolia TaxID=4212 RepID=A0AAD5CCU7_AMBAR|nr:hypothetical protein M8C21_016153 [Ambrosia artemisiifolia]
MATASTHLQLTILLALLVLACFLEVLGSEKKTPLGFNGSQVGVTFQISKGSDVKVTIPTLETTMWPETGGRPIVSQINVASYSAKKSCKGIEGLCNRNCLTGCCNERCSKRFTNGSGKCMEPMLPSTPCLCHYTC